jgi:hypothetical protein
MSSTTKVQGLQSLITTVAHAEREHKGETLHWDGHQLGSSTWRSRLVERWQTMTKGRGWVHAEQTKMRQAMIDHFKARIVLEFGESFGATQKAKIAKLLDERETGLVSLQELRAQQQRGEMPSATSLQKLVSEVQHILLNEASLGEHSRRLQLEAERLGQVDALGAVIREVGFKIDNDIPYRIKLKHAEDGSVVDSMAIDQAIGLLGRQTSFNEEEIERYDMYRRGLLAEGDRLLGIEQSLQASIAALSFSLEDLNTEVEHGERIRLQISEAKAALAENAAIGNRLFEQYQEADSKLELAVSRRQDALDLLSRLFIHIGTSQAFVDEPKQALMAMLNNEFSLHNIDPPRLDSPDAMRDFLSEKAFAAEMVGVRDRSAADEAAAAQARMVAANEQSQIIAAADGAGWHRPEWGSSHDRELASVVTGLGDRALLRAMAEQHAPEWLLARAQGFAAQSGADRVPPLSPDPADASNAGWFGKLSKLCAGIAAVFWRSEEVVVETSKEVLQRKYLEHLEQCVVGHELALKAYAKANPRIDLANPSDDELRQKALLELLTSSRDTGLRCLVLCACRFDTEDAFRKSMVGEAMMRMAPELSWNAWIRLDFDEALEQFSAIASREPIDPAIFTRDESPGKAEDESLPASEPQAEMLEVAETIAALVPDIMPTGVSNASEETTLSTSLEEGPHPTAEAISNPVAPRPTVEEVPNPVAPRPTAELIPTPAALLNEQCLKLAGMCLEERLDHYLLLPAVQGIVDRYKLQSRIVELRDACKHELERRFAVPLGEGESAKSRFEHFGQFLIDRIEKIVADLSWPTRVAYRPFASKVAGKLNDVEAFVSAEIDQFEQAKRLALSPTP